MFQSGGDCLACHLIAIRLLTVVHILTKQRLQVAEFYSSAARSREVGVDEKDWGEVSQLPATAASCSALRFSP